MNGSLPGLVIILAAAALIATRNRSRAADAQAVAREQPVAASAATDAPAVQSPYSVVKQNAPSVGETLLAHIAARLERRSSVAARLAVSGNNFSGKGNYWQQGEGEELRVRLELQLLSQEASLLQISDSRYLWLDRKIPTGRLVTRIKLRQLRADPTLTPANLDDPQPGTASWSPTGSGLTSYSGGLPSLLASLVENFEFLTPQAMRRAADSDSAKAASFPVYAVVGHWRKEKLAALLVKSQESSVESQEPESLDSPLSNLNSVPARMPEEVLILVGQADLFPYHIEYRKLETPPASADGPPIPFQLSANPLAALEFTDVVFDVPIATGQFDYAPGDANWSDQTDVVLERLRQQRDQLATRSPQDDATSRK